MQTIKTFVVVGLLLAVCYGAFVALNAPEVSIPEELEQWAQSTSEKTLQEFEIPSLSLPEPFPPDIHSPKVSKSNTENFLGSGQNNNPQFPAIDLPLPTVNLPLEGDPASMITGNSGTSSNEPASSLPSTSFGVPVATNLSAPSGATLSSTPIPSDAGGFSVPVVADSSLPFGTDQQPFPKPSEGAGTGNPMGPSVALDSVPAFEDSAIDDLIGAIGESSDVGDVGSFSPAFPSGSFPNGLDSMGQDDLLPGDGGRLASRTLPNEAKTIESLGSSGNTEPVLSPFAQARSRALEMAGAGELTRALELLSQYYESPELSYAEHTDLVDILDALAREVIYSDRPLLRPKHTVSVQDTLAGLAEKHRVNSEFIAAINNMGQSQALLANTQIKLIDGPFRAQVSLSRGELTLFLRKLYAGRFPISVSQKNMPPLGTYEIVDRRKDRTYYSANAVIPAEAPTNPFGGYWLSLGGNLSIHGSPQQVTGELEGAGCISLAPLDAADVYRILAKGSSVEIRP